MTDHDADGSNNIVVADPDNIHLVLRQDGVEATLEVLLLADIRSWLADAWPFSNVAFPGRDISWQEWNALPDRPV